MKKKSCKNSDAEVEDKIGGKLSALDKKELVLTNIPYALAAFYADRAFFFTGTVREKIWGTNYYMRWNMQIGSLQGFC